MKEEQAQGVQSLCNHTKCLSFTDWDVMAAFEGVALMWDLHIVSLQFFSHFPRSHGATYHKLLLP